MVDIRTMNTRQRLCQRVVWCASGVRVPMNEKTVCLVGPKTAKRAVNIQRNMDPITTAKKQNPNNNSGRKERARLLR